MKYKRVIGVLLVLLGLLIYPTEAFASEETLPSGIKDSEIGKVIEDYIEANKDTTAAVSIAVFRGEETIHKTAYGHANIENGLKADDETVYEWGSISKLLTWISVMQLWEEGKIDLEADVKEYLPENFFTKLKHDEPITMINLMNHNAGFEDTVFQLCAEDESSVLSLEEVLKITEPYQVYKSGEVVSYSNWSTALAGYIVERISGQPFYEYVQEHIFKPLEMNDTGLEPAYSDNLWVKSKLLENEGYTYDLRPMKDGLFLVNLYPAGSTAGTLGDIVKLAKALVPDSVGSKKLFKNEETLAEILSPSLKYPGTEVDYVNHGFWSHEYNVQALGHGGNTNMYSSYLLFDPVSSVGTVVLTNQASEFTYNYGIAPMIFGKMGAMAAEERRNKTSEIQGLYYNGRTILNGIGKLYTVLNIQPYINDDNGNLNSSIPGILKRQGRQIAPNTFAVTMESGPLVMNSIERYSNINGIKRLSSPYGQSIVADKDVWALAIGMVLLIIAVLWSVLVLLSNLIRFIIKKVKKGVSRYDSFKKYEIILSISILLIVVDIALVASKMMSLVPRSSLIINIITAIILAMAPIGYA
ncbi:MAG TPA: serine hydrolase, partial [Clostridiales bacterium]|nr:serine hydrolase [Clostridiales bacterium]